MDRVDDQVLERQPPVQPHAAQISLQDLPIDILNIIMDNLLPHWALLKSSRGPGWTIKDVTTTLDLHHTTINLHSLVSVSHHMHRIATPYLYRMIHLRDESSMLSLWHTLSVLQVSNTTLVRDLLVGIELYSPMVNYHTTLLLNSQYLPMAGCMDAFIQIMSPMAARMPVQIDGLAGGQSLVTTHIRPNILALPTWVCFEIIKRLIHLQNLVIIPPQNTDTNASLLFRRALAMSASPSLLQPTSIPLHRLHNITLQVKGCCRDYLTVYGILILPLLSRMTLSSAFERWVLDLNCRDTENERSTVLQKIKSLFIVAGRHSPAGTGDLRLGLEHMPRLSSIVIQPHHQLLSAQQYPFLYFPQLADLNVQLGRHAQQLKLLDLRWCLNPHSILWGHLGPSKRLVCLPKFQNLVKLQVTTQVLFGSMSQLRERLLLPAHDDHNLARFVGRLPDSLQHIKLLEWWPSTELTLANGRRDDTALATCHGKGDWMEARWEEEALFRADVPLEQMITRPEDVAILNLMRLLCNTWLASRPEARGVDLVPQRSVFYGKYTHCALLATDGLETMISETESSQCWIVYSYKFVPAIYLRIPGTVVSGNRP